MLKEIIITKPIEYLRSKINDYKLNRKSIKVGVINKSTNELPSYSTEGDSGMDVRAYLPDGDLILAPFERALIPTGLYFELPKGYEIQVRPRSGLAIKEGLTVLNTPGTVDEGYRGEVKIILINLSNEPKTIKNSDRIAQLVLQKVPKMNLVLQTGFINSNTERSDGGFGHTGK